MTGHSFTGQGHRRRGVAVLVVTVFVVALGLALSAPGAAIARAVVVRRADPPAPSPTETTQKPQATAPETTAAPVTPASTDQPQTSYSSPESTYQSQRQSQSRWHSEEPDTVVGESSQYASEDSSTSTADTAPMTTTEDLLIGPATTPAPTTTVAKRSLSRSTVTRTGGSSDPKIWAVVAGLGAVAIGLGFATFLYWRRTRPTDEGSGERHGRKGRSRYADLVITTPDSP